MNEDILKSLDSSEKANLQKGLEALIEQTYVIEKEYKQLNENYISLRQMVSEIIEVLPHALWIIENDEIILQNNIAKENPKLLRHIDTSKHHYELELKKQFYLIKIAKLANKFIINAIDISDEKRNERLASMGKVAAHLAHEIRNPIGSISLLNSTLYDKTELKNKHIVLEIQKAIARVERIINSTLLFTKGVQINKTSFNMLELKEEGLEAINSYNYQANISFDFQLLDQMITADKALLALILQNLIYNAIDAIEEKDEEGGKVEIKAKIEADLLYIYIYDNGIDIKDESLVFEAFKTTKLKGNGLGLSLSRQIARAHGGQLSFKTQPKCFYFSFKYKD